ncbi:hypothetical protein HG530_007917 [Fusarium avenaceum]|nr:hypothetical protein HG530_007917 [Fusarium avenaceum]
MVASLSILSVGISTANSLRNQDRSSTATKESIPSERSAILGSIGDLVSVSWSTRRSLCDKAASIAIKISSSLMASEMDCRRLLTDLPPVTVSAIIWFSDGTKCEKRGNRFQLAVLDMARPVCISGSSSLSARPACMASAMMVWNSGSEIDMYAAAFIWASRISPALRHIQPNPTSMAMSITEAETPRALRWEARLAMNMFAAATQYRIEIFQIHGTERPVSKYHSAVHNTTDRRHCLDYLSMDVMEHRLICNVKREYSNICTFDIPIFQETSIDIRVSARNRQMSSTIVNHPVAKAKAELAAKTDKEVCLVMRE